MNPKCHANSVPTLSKFSVDELLSELKKRKIRCNERISQRRNLISQTRNQISQIEKEIQAIEDERAQLERLLHPLDSA